MMTKPHCFLILTHPKFVIAFLIAGDSLRIKLEIFGRFFFLSRQYDFELIVFKCNIRTKSEPVFSRQYDFDSLRSCLMV